MNRENFKHSQEFESVMMASAIARSAITDTGYSAQCIYCRKHYNPKDGNLNKFPHEKNCVCKIAIKTLKRFQLDAFGNPQE